MRIGVAQTQPAFGKVESNVSDCLDLISWHAADLWVLPELFSTGYQFASTRELRSLSEPVPDGPTTQALIAYAADKQCHVVAGLAERCGDHLYNASVLVGPEGCLAVYRKIHLFFREAEHFTPGDRPFAVLDVGLARVGQMVCFDHLFPESARSLALQGADIIAHPSNLVLPDLAQRTMVLRSLENGVFTATANRVGTEARREESLLFTGQSQIVDPQGTVLIRLSHDRVEASVVDVNPELARDKQITIRNHKLADRRPDLYTLRPPTQA